MKIAIPLDEDQTSVCCVLARAPYFYFVCDGTSSISENPAAQSQSGAGLLAAQFLVDQQITHLITPRCGENAAQVFRAAGFGLYKSRPGSAQENLDAFARNELEELTHFHAGYQGIQ